MLRDFSVLWHLPFHSASPEYWRCVVLFLSSQVRVKYIKVPGTRQHLMKNLFNANKYLGTLDPARGWFILQPIVWDQCRQYDNFILGLMRNGSLNMRQQIQEEMVVWICSRNFQVFQMNFKISVWIWMAFNKKPFPHCQIIIRVVARGKVLLPTITQSISVVRPGTGVAFGKCRLFSSKSFLTGYLDQ